MNSSSVRNGSLIILIIYLKVMSKKNMASLHFQDKKFNLQTWGKFCEQVLFISKTFLLFIQYYSKSHVSFDYLLYKEDNKINREISVFASFPHYKFVLLSSWRTANLIRGIPGHGFRSTCIYCARTIFTLECKRSSSSPSCCGAYAYSCLDTS